MHVWTVPVVPGSAPRPGPGVRTLLVVNVHARTGAWGFLATREALARQGVDVDGAVALRTPSLLPETLREAMEAGAQRILVGGGDGTLSLAASVLAGTDTVLGVIPLGTGNDFARSLGLPLDVDGAARVVREGVVHAVDVGLANGRVFLNAASVGLSVAIARRLTPRLKRWAGGLAYAVAAAREALGFTPLTVRLSVDGERHTLDVLELVVGNGRFHGAGNVIAPAASLEDGRLHAYAILAHGAPREGAGGPAAALHSLAVLARVSPRLRRGTQQAHPDVLAFSGREMVVETDRPQRINVDGEMRGRTPVHLTVWPRAVRVLVRGDAPVLH